VRFKINPGNYFRAGGELFQRSLGNEQAGVLQFLAALAVGGGRGHVHWLGRVVIAIDRVVPAFNVQIGIVTGAQKGMNNFRPIRLAQPRKTMFRHARMADAVGFEKGPVDIGVLGVNVKNSRTKFVNVGNGVDELAHEMAGVPFDANILALGSG